MPLRWKQPSVYLSMSTTSQGVGCLVDIDRDELCQECWETLKALHPLGADRKVTGEYGGSPRVIADS